VYETQPNFISPSALEIKETLGTGGFGEVKLAVWKGFQDVAVKYITAESSSSSQDTKQRMMRSLRKEVMLLKDCIHPNIIQVLGWNFQHFEPFFVMEYMAKNSLCGCIKDQPSEFHWGKLGKKMAMEAAAGLCHLHTKQPTSVVHFDLKTLNILVSADNVAKLADVGLAQTIGISAIQPEGMTRWYAAPEIITGFGGTNKSDIFSFGVVLITILKQREPVNHADEHIYSVPGAASKDPELNALVCKCITHTPTDRPTAREVIDVLKQLNGL
jgi:serine/threonine protein kinase